MVVVVVVVDALTMATAMVVTTLTMNAAVTTGAVIIETSNLTAV